MTDFKPKNPDRFTDLDDVVKEFGFEKIPGFRESDNCLRCRFLRSEFHGNQYCGKYNYKPALINILDMVCDDFEAGE